MAWISAENVSLDIPVYNANQSSLRKTLLGLAGSGAIRRIDGRHIGVRALNDLSFEAFSGDRIALMGLNGAGKSTLLRVLAGIYPPSSGRVVRQGQVASLFDVGQGLDPEATGYQNILLKGLFLGMSRRDIDARMDDIVGFTELENYLSMPVRTYSTGMMMRLAFAVMTSVEPDIILMDEWIGVGDAYFLEKATRRLEDMIARSSILVIASHSESVLNRLCNRGLLLNKGNIIADSTIEDVKQQYSYFGPEPFFNTQAYLKANPDVAEAVARGDTQPWLHFMIAGVFESRDLGNGIHTDEFRLDPVYLEARAAGDNVRAIQRIAEVAPFLPGFQRPPGWRLNSETPFPTDFVTVPGDQLVVPEEIAQKGCR